MFGKGKKRAAAEGGYWHLVGKAWAKNFSDFRRQNQNWNQKHVSDDAGYDVGALSSRRGVCTRF